MFFYAASQELTPRDSDNPFHSFKKIMDACLTPKELSTVEVIFGLIIKYFS